MRNMKVKYFWIKKSPSTKAKELRKVKVHQTKIGLSQITAELRNFYKLDDLLPFSSCRLFL